MRTRLFVGFAALLACVALLGRAQVAPPSTGQSSKMQYTLRFKSVVGDAFKYKTTMDSTMEMKVGKGEGGFPAGGNGITTSTARCKTVGVKPDGTIVQAIDTRGVIMTGMGEEFSTPTTPPDIVETDRFGRSKPRHPAVAKGVAWTKLRPPALLSESGMGVYFPENPVTVGESWTTELPSPNGDARTSITSTLVSAEMLNGKLTLKIKQSVSEPLDMRIGANGFPRKSTDKARLSLMGTSKTEMMSRVWAENGRTISTIGETISETTMTVGAEGPSAPLPSGTKMTIIAIIKMNVELLSAGKVSDEVKPVGKKASSAKATVKKPVAKQRKP